MRDLEIHVVDQFAPEDGWFSRFPGALTGEGRPIRILWIPIPASSENMDVDEYVRSAAPRHLLRQADAAFLVVRQEFADYLNSDLFLVDALVARLEGTIPTIVTTPSRTYPVDTDDGVVGVQSQLIRQADTQTLAMRPGVLLPPNNQLHYEGPNGAHYRSFLRFGMGLRSIEELDRIAFWLVPSFQDIDVVIVDTWSLQSLAMHCLRVAGSEADVLSLRSYDETGSADIIGRLSSLYGHKSGARVLAVLSAVSSGSMIARLQEAADLCDMVLHRAVSIFGPATLDVQGVDYKSFARHSDLHSFQPPDECDACSNQSTSVPIEPDTYLLALDSVSVLTAIKRSDAAPTRDLVETYADEDGYVESLCLHRTHAGQNARHQAFYVDVERLMQHPNFSGRLKVTRDRFLASGGGASDVILHPDERSSQRFAVEFGAGLGIPTVAVDEARILRDPAYEPPDELLAASKVAFFDDVVISGTRLLGVRNALIRAKRRAGLESVFELYAAVAVARPPTQSALRGIRDVTHHVAVDGRERFFAVEEILLPDWGRRECPWCHELNILEQIDDPSRTMVDRVRDLMDVGSGLSRCPFLGFEEEAQTVNWTHDSSFKWDELNQGSVFGEKVQGSALVFSVASAIQRLRVWPDSISSSGSRLDDRFHSPISKRLDPRLYLSGRYYESVLVASILRSAKPHDIRPPSTNPDLNDILTRHVDHSPTGAELKLELALAVARGQLPFAPFAGGNVIPPGSPEAILSAIQRFSPDLRLERLNA